MKAYKFDLKKIAPYFRKWWIESDHYTYNVLKGGRGSGKSTTVAYKLIRNRMKYNSNAIVLRKVGRTLEKSVYNQIKWCINQMGFSPLFKFKKSPLEIEYIPKGTLILFFGLDDSDKLKSLKTDNAPITECWIEELAEFKNEDEIISIENSVLRDILKGILRYRFYYTYNPPKRKTNWCNKKYNSKFINKDTLVNHSTYLNNPFITEELIKKANNLKETNELKYRWVYLGEAIGGGVVPFENLTFRTITNDEISSFDNIYQGLDFGFGGHPLALENLHFEKAKRRIFLLDEIFGLKIGNSLLARKIKDKKFDKFLITADSASPNTIHSLKEDFGIEQIIGAKKGAGTRESYQLWLEDCNEIIIDYNRTPGAAKQFENIDYEIDKDGNTTNRLEKIDDDAIDATKYALESEIKNNFYYDW